MKNNLSIVLDFRTQGYWLVLETKKRLIMENKTQRMKLEQKKGN